jgi:Yip1-like protein
MTDGPINPTPGSTPPGAPVSLVDRVKNILTSPATEWPRIDAESTSVGRLVTGYALILGLIAPLAVLLGFLIQMGGLAGPVMGFLIKILIIVYVINVGVIVALGFIIDLLAPNLGGTRNAVQAMKLAVYSATPMWLAGILLVLLPGQWLLVALIGIAYGGYLIYVGLPTLMRVPPDKAPAYTAAAVGIWFVLFIIAQQIGWRLMFTGYGFYYGGGPF